MKQRRTMYMAVLGIVAAASAGGCAKAAAAPLPVRFELSFPAELRSQPITGRVFVTISRTNSTEPRLQAGGMTSVPLFGADVDQWAPGRMMAIDASVLGYPLRSLSDIDAADYYVQAVVNIYSQFHRKDGHTIWAHNDQWEGQQWNRSSGNLYSTVQKVHLDPTAGYAVTLRLDHKLPPIGLICVTTDSTCATTPRVTGRRSGRHW